MVAGFTGSDRGRPAGACTYDFEVAAAKYLHALDDGEIPLSLLFSGTVFVRPRRRRVGAAGAVARRGELPPAGRVWRELMDRYFPNSGWIRLRRETLDALTRYKAERALPVWDEAFERLLKEADGEP